MGYNTEFEGFISIEPPLNTAEVEYLTKFSETRRMHRRSGPYFVEGSGFHGQDVTDDVIDNSSPAAGQPGLWCQWIPTEDGTRLVWDQVEKFYESPEWMTYLIDHFLRPDALASRISDPMFAEFTFDHICFGVIRAEGEDSSDLWSLIVVNNQVTVSEGHVPDVIYAQAHVGRATAKIAAEVPFSVTREEILSRRVHEL